MDNMENSWYLRNYNRINATAKEGSIYSKVLHKSLEWKHKSNYGLHILEVGSNKGEHIQYVRDDWKLGGGSYHAIDLRSLDSEVLKKFRELGINYHKQNVENLEFEDNTFDRVISTCLFHHLVNPQLGFQEIRRVTRIGGRIDIFLPNDPGIAYRFLRRITTIRNARKFDLEQQVELVHALEHRNHFLSLEVLSRYEFSADYRKLIGFPFHRNFYNLNAFSILSIVKNAN